MNVIKFNFLLKQYKSDPAAVREFYEWYYPIIVRYINRQFRGQVDGEDVAQQFFLRLFQNKSNTIRAPNAWIHTVVRNIAIDILRKNGRWCAEDEIDSIPDRDETYFPEEFSDILDCLNEEEKHVIYLHYWENYRLCEIAELLSKKYGRVKTIHATAKRKIKKDFKELS